MNINTAANAQKSKDDQAITERVSKFYIAKYGKQSPSETIPDVKLTLYERQQSDQAFSDGIYKANKTKTDEMLGALEAIFAAKAALKK